MQKVAALAILFGCLLGCQGSQPSYNLLAPYGSCRVPPPSTGNHSSAAGYYTPTTPPTVTVPAGQGNATLGAPSAQAPQPGNTQMASGTWVPTGAAATGQTVGVAAPGTQLPVQQASFREPTPASGGPAGTLKLNGMRVNDATSVTPPVAPAQFVPPTQMTPLSQVPVPAGPGVPSGTVVSSAQASDSITPGTPQMAASGSTLNWQTR